LASGFYRADKLFRNVGTFRSRGNHPKEIIQQIIFRFVSFLALSCYSCCEAQNQTAQMPLRIDPQTNCLVFLRINKTGKLASIKSYDFIYIGYILCFTDSYKAKKHVKLYCTYLYCTCTCIIIAFIIMKRWVKCRSVTLKITLIIIIIIIIIIILRKVLNAETSDMSTMNSNTRIAATRCSLGTWFVSGM
jgi:hypothetical protein